MPTLYCRHIKVNGRRCLSPAMRGRALCYFHTRAHERHHALLPPVPPPPAPSPEGELILHPMNTDPGHLQRSPQLASPAEYLGPPPQSPASAPLLLPALEDRESIQLALSVALQALAQNRIDVKRAYTLLFGLQVASRNAGNLSLDSERVVVDTIADEAGHELAPDEDPIEIVQTEALLHEIAQSGEEEDDEEDDDIFDGEDEGNEEPAAGWLAPEGDASV